jgi:hypothetical protein
MSSWSATIYSSAAPSYTSPTSTSRRTSTACASPILQALDKAHSPTLHITKSAIFGLELGVTKRRFSGLTDSGRIATLARPSDKETATQEKMSEVKITRKKSAHGRSFGEEAAIVSIGAVTSQWMARSAAQHPITFFAVGGALWLVFGGYQKLEQRKQQAKLALRPNTTHKNNAQLDSASVVITTQEPATLPSNLVENVVTENTNVQTWLNAEYHSDSDGGIVLPQDGEDVYGVDTEELISKSADEGTKVEITKSKVKIQKSSPEERDAPEVKTTLEEKPGPEEKIAPEEEDSPEKKDAARKNAEQAREDIDLAFRDFFGLLDTFDVDMHIEFHQLAELIAAFDDYVGCADVVEWTYTLPGIFDEDNYNAYVDLLAWTYSLPGDYEEKWSLRVEVFSRQAESPIFHEGDLDDIQYKMYGHKQAVFHNITRSGSSGTRWASVPGRPVSADAGDINHLWNALKLYLPQWFMENTPRSPWKNDTRSGSTLASMSRKSYSNWSGTLFPDNMALSVPWRTSRRPLNFSTTRPY